MLAVLMIGCGEPEVGADSPNVSDYYDLDTAAAEVVPLAGQWIYDDLTVLSARCQSLEEILPFAAGEDFKIFQVDERSFLMKLPGIEQSTRCSLADAGFSCDALEGTTEADGYNITLLSDLLALGVFIDTGQARGRYDLTVDCEGAVCGAAAVYYGVSFPCELAVEFVALRQ